MRKNYDYLEYVNNFQNKAICIRFGFSYFLFLNCFHGNSVVALLFFDRGTLISTPYCSRDTSFLVCSNPNY